MTENEQPTVQDAADDLCLWAPWARQTIRCAMFAAGVDDADINADEVDSIVRGILFGKWGNREGFPLREDYQNMTKAVIVWCHRYLQEQGGRD